MRAYAVVGSNRLEEATAFYDALLGMIGMRKMFDHPSGGRVYVGADKEMFGVLGPYDGGAASVGNGSMFGFGLDSHAEVDAFHAKAIALGATSDGDPGPRGGEKSTAYFGYFRDLDGNKLCTFKFG